MSATKVQTILLPEVFKRNHEAHFVEYDMAPFIRGDKIINVTTMPDNPASQMTVNVEVVNNCILRALFRGGLLSSETHDIVVETKSGQVFGFTVRVRNRNFDDIAWTGDNTCVVQPADIIDGGTF